MNYYTFGYAGRRLDTLIGCARTLGAVVVDIRFSAKSRLWEWNGRKVSEQCELKATTYIHVPDLGNVNYKSGGEITIKDMERGIGTVLRLAQPAILFCGCSEANYRLCHRRTIADHLIFLGHSVEEITIVKDPAPLPIIEGETVCK